MVYKLVRKYMRRIDVNRRHDCSRLKFHCGWENIGDIDLVSQVDVTS
jgi:hypothetical protein